MIAILENRKASNLSVWSMQGEPEPHQTQNITKILILSVEGNESSELQTLDKVDSFSRKSAAE
jgi:hypothetical protein